MTDKFVIVVEVDNKRALAAYERGLEQLERIWPRVIAYAERTDKVANEQWVVVDAWMARNRTNREAGRPREPMPLAGDIFIKMQAGQIIRNAYLKMYTDMRRELINMVRLASVAVSPFRMTEHQVRAMFAWGDGSRIESLAAEIEGEA